MSSYFDIAVQAARATAAPIYADEIKRLQLRNGQQNDRIQQLEVALNRMICGYENTLTDSAGEWPQKDSGCPDCTSGTVPDSLNTGPCYYHNAKRLLGQL